MTDGAPRFMPSLTDREAAAALDARERREEARNREGFKDCGLRAGETLRGLDGRVWRVLGPSVLRGNDPLVRVEEVATGRVTHRYARTVALWAPTELDLASPAERHRTQADGDAAAPSQGGGPPSPTGAAAQTLHAKRPAMPGGPHEIAPAPRERPGT
jgi:hypothetical protein